NPSPPPAKPMASSAMDYGTHSNTRDDTTTVKHKHKPGHDHSWPHAAPASKFNLFRLFGHRGPVEASVLEEARRAHVGEISIPVGEFCRMEGRVV
ncbi:hypothetical protein HDV00_012292, partial [Rhizophlyctis rosea]